MGDFQSGKWIVGLLIYFFFFFVLIFSLLNAQSVIAPQSEVITVNDPGFQERGNDFLASDYCSGTSNAMNIFGIIPCKSLDIEQEETCNGVEGCRWQNATLLFNITISDAVCTDNLNLSYYNLSGGRAAVCDNISSQYLCDLIQCTWTNQADMIQEPVSLGDTTQLTTVWDTIKFIALFRADIGLGTFTFLFSFLFFYVPFIMLIWSLYMAIPFFH